MNAVFAEKGESVLKTRHKLRYELAVYLLLAALAIITALIGLNYSNPPFAGLFLNLSSELAGVVLIFFIVRRLFLLDGESDLLEGISDLRTEILSGGSPFRSSLSSRRDFNFSERIRTAKTLDLLGYSLANLLGNFRAEIAEAISRGTCVRIMLLDPASVGGTSMIEKIADPSRVWEPHERSLRYTTEIRKLVSEKGAARGWLKTRLIPWVPSCYLNIFDGNTDDGFALVGIHSLTIRSGVPKRLHLLISKAHHHREFNYFASQFDLLWNEYGDNSLPHATHELVENAKPESDEELGEDLSEKFNEA